MRILVAALVIVGSVGYAQQSGSEADPKGPDGKDAGVTKVPASVRRLDAVTWEPLKAQLSWVVSVWNLESDMSEPSGLERYVIHVDSGQMESNGELREFEVPGSDLHALMSLLSKYTIRSTIWWDHPGASKEDAPVLAPDGTGGSKDKTKGNDPKDPAKPAVPTKVAGVAQLRSLGQAPPH